MHLQTQSVQVFTIFGITFSTRAMGNICDTPPI